MYFDLEDQNEEELEKKRIEKENAKRKILEQMRERKIIRQEYERAEQQDAEEKQQQEETKKDLLITNLRWEHTEKDVSDKRPDFVAIGDKIKLLADVENGDGNKSLFEVHDLNIPYSLDPEQLVVDKSSKVDAGATSVEWKVSDPRSKKDPDREIDLYFLVKVKDVYSENCEIPVQEVKAFTVRLFIDPNAMASQDDKYILNSSDESYNVEQTVKDDKVPGDDYLDLMFTGIEPDKEYSLIIDPGKEMAPYYSFKNIKGEQLLNEPANITYDESLED